MRIYNSKSGVRSIAKVVWGCFKISTTESLTNLQKSIVSGLNKTSSVVHTGDVHILDCTKNVDFIQGNVSIKRYDGKPGSISGYVITRNGFMYIEKIQDSCDRGRYTKTYINISCMRSSPKAWFSGDERADMGDIGEEYVNVGITPTVAETKEGGYCEDVKRFSHMGIMIQYRDVVMIG